MTGYKTIIIFYSKDISSVLLNIKCFTKYPISKTYSTLCRNNKKKTYKYAAD